MLEYAKAVNPRDLLVFTDTDVIINARMRVGDVFRRFDAARLGSRLLFQAEPICFAPRIELVGRRNATRTHCSDQMLREYALGPTGTLPWDCPRFVNAGAYAGYAADLVPVLRQWLQPWVWAPPCIERPRFGWDDQCIVTAMALRGNVSIRLDAQEAMFASAGTVRPCTASRFRCWECGRPKREGTQSRPRCDVDTTFAWKAQKDGLQRLPEYTERCRGAGLTPLIMHFNGASKKIMTSPQILGMLDQTSEA